MQEKSSRFCEVIKDETIFEPQNRLIFEYFCSITFPLFERAYNNLIMSDSTDDLPFSQRYGHVPVIQQLALGEIPIAFKEEIKFILDTIIPGRIYPNNVYKTINSYYVPLVREIFINICRGNYQQFSREKSFVNNFLFNFVDKCKFFELFDLLEKLMKDLKKLQTNDADHDKVNKNLEDVFKIYFKKHHLAYTIYNEKIVPISNETEGETYVAALDETKDTGQLGAHSHLIKAGEQINHQKWADSVRESISAVEAICRQIVGENATLGSALNKIEKNYPLHPAFKKALSELYGFTSDENGIRHSLLDKSTAAVDEADALFMLGACASFVSYLLSRTRSKDDK